MSYESFSKMVFAHIYVYIDIIDTPLPLTTKRMLFGWFSEAKTLQKQPFVCGSGTRRETSGDLGSFSSVSRGKFQAYVEVELMQLKEYMAMIVGPGP